MTLVHICSNCKAQLKSLSLLELLMYYRLQKGPAGTNNKRQYESPWRMLPQIAKASVRLWETGIYRELLELDTTVNNFNDNVNLKKKKDGIRFLVTRTNEMILAMVSSVAQSYIAHTSRHKLLNFCIWIHNLWKDCFALSGKEFAPRLFF